MKSDVWPQLQSEYLKQEEEYALYCWAPILRKILKKKNIVIDSNMPLSFSSSLKMIYLGADSGNSTTLRYKHSVTHL